MTKDVSGIRPEHEPGRVFKYADISSIDNRRSRIASLKSFSGRDAPSRARRPVRPGDVLFSNVRTYLRNVALIEPDPVPDVCSTGFAVLRSNGAVLPRYLLRYVLTDDFIDRVSETQTGTHYPATSDRQVLSQSLLLPPLAEQERIVSLLERLLAKVDECRDRLDRVPGILSRFRQAILAAACSGRLTEDWRLDSGRKSESAPIRNRVLPRPDEFAYMDLPAGWRWTAAGSAYLDACYGTSSKCHADADGVPVLRVPNIAAGRLDLTDMKYAATGEALTKLILEPGDIVICRTNGSIDLIGKAAVIPPMARPHAFASYLIRLRIDTTILLPDYFHLLLSSPLGRLQLTSKARTSAGQFNINLAILRELAIPLPSVEEQQEITKRAKRLLETADSVERRAGLILSRVRRLHAALLSRAFRGELVPAEAELARAEGRGYESAEALLERSRTDARSSDSSSDLRPRRSRRAAAR